MRSFGSLVSAILIPALVAAPVFGGSVAPNELHIDTKSQNGAFLVTVTDENGAGVPDAAVIVRLPETGDTGTFADGTHVTVSYTDQHGEAHTPTATWSSAKASVPVKITATKSTARAGMLFNQELGKQKAPARSIDAVPLQKAAPPAIVQPGHLQNAAAAPPQITPTAQESVVPMVSITHGPSHEHLSGGSHKKWIMLAIAAGAGGGIAFALAGRKPSSSSNSSSSALSIGTPTISVGTP